jgi:hypothetical protein
MATGTGTGTGRPTLLTVTGRDVLFAHWRVDPAAVAAAVPDPLAVDTFDGSAWVSALALENDSVAPGSTPLPDGLRGGFPQLNVRTYVTLDGDPGVYFFSLYSGRLTPATVARRTFGLPFRHARMRLTRRGEEVTFGSRCDGDPPAVFRARYRPDGASYGARPGSVEAFCVERSRYYLPASDGRRPALVPSVGAAPGGTYVGTIDRDPWRLRPVDVRVRRDTLFEAAGLPAPTGDPVCQYSPGFEMGVEAPVVRRPDAGSGSSP